MILFKGGYRRLFSVKKTPLQPIKQLKSIKEKLLKKIDKVI